MRCSVGGWVLHALFSANAPERVDHCSCPPHSRQNTLKVEPQNTRLQPPASCNRHGGTKEKTWKRMTALPSLGVFYTKWVQPYSDGVRRRSGRYRKRSHALKMPLLRSLRQFGLPLPPRRPRPCSLPRCTTPSHRHTPDHGATHLPTTGYPSSLTDLQRSFRHTPTES